MSKLTTGIAIGLLLGLLGYYVMTFSSSNEVVSNDFARVTIRNESGKNAEEILLTHGQGSIQAKGIRDKEEIRFIFKNGGENSYKIIVTFHNGLTLTSNEVYFEHGYRGVETIKDSEITTENNW